MLQLMSLCQDSVGDCTVLTESCIGLI
uniref:Uncharacterized protein n=1 Tax=Arundo donax TaxID=35708 RepID=A0A0A8Y0R9_ARUDO